MTDPTSDITDVVLLLDDLALRRAGLEILLGRWACTEGLTLISCSRHLGEELSQNVRLILLVSSRGGDEQSAPGLIEKLHCEYPDAHIAILADENEMGSSASHALGISGFISTDLEPNVAFKALSFVLAGGQCFPPASRLDDPFRSNAMYGVTGFSGGALTHRQNEIREALQEGYSNKVIARKLNISEATVKLHVRHIMRKLGVSNRTQVALSGFSRNSVPQTGNVAAKLETVAG